jgi:hypothetical protein
MLTYLFYFSLVYGCSIYALLLPGCSWLIDMAIVHAGAAVQVSSEKRDSFTERTPNSDSVEIVFKADFKNSLILLFVCFYFELVTKCYEHVNA